MNPTIESLKGIKKGDRYAMETAAVNNVPKKERTLAQKVGHYSFMLAIIAIFAEIVFPFMGYVSMAAISVSYISNIWREWEVEKKLDPISLILCTLAVSWVFARQFIGSDYTLLFGQLVSYGFLIRSSYKSLGYVDKGFLCLVVFAITVGVLRLVYPSKLTDILNICMSIWIIFRFLDPILRKIALDHRAKRLAAAAKAQEDAATTAETATEAAN